MFTSPRVTVPELDDATAQARDRKTDGSTAERHAESSPSGCAPSFVPRQPLFRSGRYRSGQVRNASTGPCRPPAHLSSCTRFWVFSPLFLSGQFQFFQGRAGGIGAIKTRPQGWPQANAGSDGLYRRAQAESSLTVAQLAELIKERFDIQVHPRSIERQLLRERKRR